MTGREVNGAFHAGARHRLIFFARGPIVIRGYGKEGIAMKNSLRSMLAVLLILVAFVTGCGGSSAESGSAAGAVDTQLKDDNNWQVIQTADQ